MSDAETMMDHKILDLLRKARRNLQHCVYSKETERDKNMRANMYQFKTQRYRTGEKWLWRRRRINICSH
jgi:hypothetical protein